MACSVAHTTVLYTGPYSDVSKWNHERLPKNFLNSSDTELDFSEAESVHSEQGYVTATVEDSDDSESTSGTEQPLARKHEAPGTSSDFQSDDGNDTVMDVVDVAARLRPCLMCSAPCQVLYCNNCFSDRMSNLPKRRKVSSHRHESKSKTSSKGKSLLMKHSSEQLKSDLKRSLALSEETELLKRRQELPQSILLKSIGQMNTASQSSRNIPFKSHETSQRCLSCKIRPRDACFVHTKITHQVCCIECAKHIYKVNDKRCPVCCRKIQKITRNIVA